MLSDELFYKAREFKKAHFAYFHQSHDDPEQLALARTRWQAEACEFASMVLEHIEADGTIPLAVGKYVDGRGWS
ncbi:hypothetical protein [Stutzerimonas stutzeri]|uniref:Uncharacterized protein n=1 Tax=Stutzerimonas stutzeri KOS6 TaxID=1218352 RepID=A0A061JM91_STUST|nr:hypothetical protein [Stutzerimonas stutzeri]EWC40847.1 hypothetical protein B597_012675 [Stutzerimonas stutzeri KOS6]